VTVAIWLGNAAPARTIRWMDGALSAAAKFVQAAPHDPPPVAIAAGDPTWLDLASDRATRVGLTTTGIATDLQLDYLGWAQVVAAAAPSGFPRSPRSPSCSTPRSSRTSSRSRPTEPRSTRAVPLATRSR
jgi:hypothetical protein